LTRTNRNYKARLSQKVTQPRPKLEDVVTVRIDPWYHRPLYAGIFAGIAGAILGASPSIYGLLQDKDQKRDVIGQSILANRPAGPFTFTDETKSTVNVRIGGVSFTKLKRWIAVNDGSGADQRIAISVGQGSFWAVMKSLNCGVTYYYRTEGEREGRIISSVTSTFFTAPCSTAYEKARASEDRAYVKSQAILEDPNLPEFNRNYKRFGDPGNWDGVSQP
jgi:hypothetical protein